MPKQKAIIALIILLSSVVGVVFYLQKAKPSLTPEPSPSPTSVTTEQMRSMMLHDSGITFGEPEQAVNIDVSSLPEAFRFLIPAEAEKVDIQQLQDGAGKKWYKISFEINQNMHDYYFQFRKDLTSKKWSTLLAQRSDLINMTELAKDLIELREEMTFITQEAVTPENMERISEESKRSQVIIQVKSN